VIGFIGGGNMAEALIKGMTSVGMKGIAVFEPRAERAQFLSRSYGVREMSTNREIVSSCDIIVLAVKPQVMDSVLDEIAEAVTEEKTIVSIAAGIPLSRFQARLRTQRLVRVMPNTPALVQEGMSVLSLCSCLPEKVIAPVRDIFMSIGKVLTLPEKHMNAVTALSGSGPAFIALFVESLIGAGVAAGLSEDNARELAVQTLIGTGRLLEAGVAPDRLRAMVTSPGGTTAAGLEVFEKRGLAGTVSEAIAAAVTRAVELGRDR
jgi:pyrroline-5-carboxylate reductase